MIRQQVHIINNIYMFLDSICIMVAGYSSFILNLYLSNEFQGDQKEIILGSIIFIIFVNNYVMGKIGLYGERNPPSYYQLLRDILKAISINFIILSAFLFLFRQVEYSRNLLVFFAVFSFLSITTQRVLVQLYIRRNTKNGYNKQKLLIVGNIDRGQIVSTVLEKQLSLGHEVVGYLPIKNENQDNDSSCAFEGEKCVNNIGSIEDLPTILRTMPIDEVIFAMHGDRSINISEYIKICIKMGVPARVLPAMWEPGVQSVSVEKWQGVPFLTFPTDNFNATGLLYKRTVDLIGGLIGTIILGMIYPFIATAIKLDSTGPVFFKQTRIGKNGRIFKLYKFRSMIINAEELKKSLMGENEMSGQIFKINNDPRITKIGKILRNTSLDEFPQFLNVLKGEMSLVGTRPPTPDEVDEYQLWHLKRISIKPGITGLWQTCGRNQIRDFDKIVELDCKYIDQWRFLVDIKILFKTVIVILQRKGAL